MTAPLPALDKSPVAFGTRGVQLTSLDELFRFAQAVVQSGLAPKSYDTPQKVLIAVQMGAELGFSPMQALTGIAVVNGRPSVMVEPALALVQASGLLVQRHERFEGEGLNRTAIVALVRKGGQAIERRFSAEDAKRARLDTKDVWKGYPDRMLYNRAMGYALKDLFPDALRGIGLSGVDDYVTDEPGVRNITPRPATVGPDPLIPLLESPATAIEFNAEPERVAVYTQENDRDAE